jgi:predicted secreted protein
VVSAANAFRRVTITVADVLKPFAALSLCNVLILSIWQWGGDSPKWQRTVRERDEFDRIVSSTGQCTNHGKSGTVYFSGLIVVNGLALALACYQAYIGRNVQTGLNESKFIGMTMICICECCFFALPLLFISGSNRSGMLFVSTSISFVICVATLLFIFVPKVIRDRKSMNRASLTTVENVQCSAPSAPSLGRSVISGLSARGLQIRALQQSSGASKFSSFRSSLGTGRRSSLRASRGGNFKPIEIEMTADKFEDYPAGYFESDENEEQKVDFPFGAKDQEKQKASEDDEGGSTNSSDLDGFPEVENRVTLGTVLSLIAEKSSEDL